MHRFCLFSSQVKIDWITGLKEAPKQPKCKGNVERKDLPGELQKGRSYHWDVSNKCWNWSLRSQLQTCCSDRTQLKKNISLKKNTKQFNERDVEWWSLLHLALLFNTSTSSTALQAFLHYVTLMNEAVMSLCSSLAIQLSSDSFMLQPLGCVNESVCETPFRRHEWQIHKHAGTLEFIPEGHQHSLWNTREWWRDPWKRCKKATAREREKENQLGSSSKAPLLPLTAICELLLITKQPTSIHRQRALGWICGLWLCTVRTANATHKLQSEHGFLWETNATQ